MFDFIWQNIFICTQKSGKLVYFYESPCSKKDKCEEICREKIRKEKCYLVQYLNQFCRTCKGNLGTEVVMYTECLIRHEKILKFRKKSISRRFFTHSFKRRQDLIDLKVGILILYFSHVRERNDFELWRCAFIGSSSVYSLISYPRGSWCSNKLRWVTSSYCLHGVVLSNITTFSVFQTLDKFYR